jgi:hypothetical protein
MAVKLSPTDASLLALVAEHPEMSDEMLRRVLRMASSGRVRTLLRALNSRRSPQGKSELKKSVLGLRLWAERNKLVHGAPILVSKRRRSS